SQKCASALPRFVLPTGLRLLVNEKTKQTKEGLIYRALPAQFVSFVLWGKRALAGRASARNSSRYNLRRDDLALGNL
ncbi:MAG TPA: hypothetical protein VGM27_06320, partial [Acidobacteriaceae bacterium]